ncbi:MAG: hypothetical protein ABI904_06355 [Chloroflexota bacterium]
MSDKIKITCPRCGHEWKASLQELEKQAVIYRGEEKPKTDVVKYRATCPVDGTYIILEIQED